MVTDLREYYRMGGAMGVDLQATDADMRHLNGLASIHGHVRTGVLPRFRQPTVQAAH